MKSLIKRFLKKLTLKQFIGLIIAISFSYNVVFQPLINDIFGLSLPKMGLDEELIKLATGIFSLMGV